MAAGAGSPLSAAPGSSLEIAAQAPGASDVPSNAFIDASFQASRLQHDGTAEGLSKGAIAALFILCIIIALALTTLVYMLMPCARKQRLNKAWQERRAAGETPYKKSVLVV